MKKYFKKFLFSLVTLSLALVLLSLMNMPLALAHESRDVAGGKYQLRVGFIEEPTYQGLENGLSLTVCKGECTSSKDNSGTLTNGLEGAFDTLKVEVIFNGKSMPLTLGPVPRNPGRYEARFVPTKAGDYTFHIFGTIEQDKIDEKFTSGPDTFDSVLPLTAAQFPDKPGYQGEVASTPVSGSATPAATTNSPAAATPAATSAAVAAAGNQATTAGVASGEISQLQQQLATQQRQLDDTRASASAANTLAIVAIVAGLVGVVMAIWAFTRIGSSRSEPGTPRPRRGPEGG
ncbi:MAG TPA: hypothetical protein VH186_05120 [Chloroflexia bacterium]|nr:hypothetical protein [Chloroflexia bacterium]